MGGGWAAALRSGGRLEDRKNTYDAPGGNHGPGQHRDNSPPEPHHAFFAATQ
jgi:hypothetical protein